MQLYNFLSGIPIAQQHLIWKTVELEDDYCLHDYSIHDGATLKLVLAMRGGPINTRRSKYAAVSCELLRSSIVTGLSL